MYIDDDLKHEINLLARFNLSTTQEGIKVHSNADKHTIAAVERLFNKGLVTQKDGGYLTELGRHAAEHTQQLLMIIKEPVS